MLGVDEVVEKGISTHAPRVRRDRSRLSQAVYVLHFYSRASCEARHQATEPTGDIKDFYSRASCEARRG